MKIMFLEMTNNVKELLQILAEFLNMFGLNKW